MTLVFDHFIYYFLNTFYNFADTLKTLQVSCNSQVTLGNANIAVLVNLTNNGFKSAVVAAECHPFIIWAITSHMRFVLKD